MNRRSMIATGAALVLLLGGAVGAYYYVDHKKSSEEAAEKAEADSLKLMEFDSNDVNAIDITTAEGYFKMKCGDNGEWTLEDTDYPYKFTPYSYQMNVIASAMSKLKADHKADTKKDDLGKYGLDSPATVICHTADKDYTVYVGSSSVTNEFCYVMLPDDDTVYCIDNATGLELRGDIAKICDPYLLECTDNEIMRFALVHNDEVVYDLCRNEDNTAVWSFNGPVTDVAIDTITVNTILTNMVRIEAADFECFTKDESELAKYGLDSPAYTFTVETSDKTITLEFPEISAEDEKVWCYDADTYEVCAISSNSAAFLSGKWQDLITKQAMSVSFYDAETLEIDVNGETHKLTVDHENSKYVYDDVDVTSKDNEEAAKNFEYLYASVSEIKHGEFREDIPEKMGEPTCTFAYTLTDGTKRKLELVPIDDSNYWAYTDGRCLGMTVERSAIDGTNGCLSFIEKLNADLGIENK
ncbi:DUF4340 domain-containing protein [Ruminococcus albus]|uniref:DUF4340 domain-containing protein n=1 Tax=Ruminococcus albus TaxID=1264 RepID=A0A1I1CWW8_RUMAL|nr:DUF4340 domain-containing protein [Ruminococcus albus]SFB66592.1 protein of unknown function [Ruminococcus albus]